MDGPVQSEDSRALTESALRRSEQRYRTVFESVDEAVCLIERLPLRADGRRDYRYLAMNGAMRRMFGIEDLTGQSIRDNFPNEVEAWYDDYDRVLETGMPIRFERESAPQSKFLEMFVTRMEDGDADTLLIVMQDITQRKQAEAVLRESERRQEFLLRFSDTIRSLNDPEAIAKTATALVAEHFQVERCFISRIAREAGKAWIEHETRRPGLASVEGEVNLADFPEVMRIAETETMVFRDVGADAALSERDKAALGGLGFGAFLAAVLRKGERNYIWDLVVASSEPRNWAVTDAPLLEELAERTWVAIERARTEKALLETEKLAVVGRLASSIAHEINNPLEAVTNLLYLMERTDLPEDAAQFLKLAQSELLRVSQITVETLRFSRQNTRATEVKLSDLIESVVNLHEARLKAAQITVERDYEEPRPLLCFPNELRQVVVNLVGNAIDAMSGFERGRLCLRVREACDPRTGSAGTRLTVADSGLGMSRATVRQIWEPFFTTKGTTGTGLGLWVTREIVGKHGGTVWVRSSTAAAHHGSVFSVFFPHTDVRSS
ncbi:PAS domain S-box protein [Acidobacteria bacterium AB60]|nr:PAS domain S-box protein [Acidobacteria bacterium AB60]